MKYLLFEYGETITKEFEFPETRYCDIKNLNVFVSNNQPAIATIENTVTQTFSKVSGESSDSDSDINMSVVTRTDSIGNSEETDDDNDVFSLSNFLITATTTRVEMESTDSD